MLSASHWINDLPAWFTVAVVMLGLYVFRKGAGGTAIGELQAANQVLERVVKKQGDEIDILRGKLAVSEARTDLTVALIPLLEAITLHEANASARSTAIIGAIESVGVMIGKGE